MKLVPLLASLVLLDAGLAFAQVCGPGNPIRNMCAEQAAIGESIDEIQIDIGDIEAQVSSTAADLSALDAKVTDIQVSVDTLAADTGRLESSLDALAQTADRIDSNLDAHRAAAHKFWTSPLWQVSEGASSTHVTALNLGAEEVEVVFTFLDRDGAIDREFSTNRILPRGASISLLLDDRGVTPGRHGWVAITASGPVQVDGYMNFSRGEIALSRQYSERTMLFYPVDCQRDPATWPTTRAPFLCDFIDRELSRLW